MTKPVAADDDAALWSFSTGSRGSTVRAYERSDKDLTVWAVYPNPKSDGRDKRLKKSLGVKVRDAKGRKSKTLIKAAENLARDMAAKIQLGQNPTVGAPAVVEDVLTLHDAFEQYMDLKTGAWATETRHRYAVGLAQKKLEELLGKDMLMRDITARKVQAMWRLLAERSKARKKNPGAGGRAAETMVDALYVVSKWLGKWEDGILDLPTPVAGWRAELKKDWFEITGVDPNVTKYLTHSPEEMGRLFRTAEANDTLDIRLRLIMTIGGEQRLGQVRVVRRSQLLLPGRDPNLDDAVPKDGLFRVLGAGKKEGETIGLTAAQRAWLEREMDGGYLSLLERARLAKVISDYPLFPGGHFDAKGRAHVKADAEPITRDGLRGMFQDLEALAGVPSIPGRGWYGIRRKASNLIRKHSTNPRVLDRVFANSDKTRKDFYEMDEDPEEIAEAREAVTAYRASLPQTP